MNSEKIIIAIDGYSSSGKSTMARRLAKTIGYRYIDSGAMYRAVTLYAMRHGFISPDGTVSTDRLVEALPDIHIDFKVDGDGQLTLLNGSVVESEIRSLEVSSHVSPIAAVPEVRHALVRMQREMGRSKGIVMDGRDIGTVVFPDAELKIFMTADPAVRARRRYDELRAKGDEVSLEEIERNIRARDIADQSREVSPLRKADDALVLDNSRMSVEEQMAWIGEKIESIIGR